MINDNVTIYDCSRQAKRPENITDYMNHMICDNIMDENSIFLNLIWDIELSNIILGKQVSLKSSKLYT